MVQDIDMISMRVSMFDRHHYAVGEFTLSAGTENDRVVLSNLALSANAQAKCSASLQKDSRTISTLLT